MASVRRKAQSCAAGSTAVTLTQDILAHALALGFDIAGVLPVGAPRHGAAFADWLAAGYHGEMAYLAARAAERADPGMFAPDAQSMILVAVSCAANNTARSEESIGSHPECFAIEGCASAISQGRIACYACGPDYHDSIKPKLHAIDAFIRARTGRESLGKAFVDTAPVLERDFAAQAGLGFIGRNCCLITPGLGSWSFLAGLLVPEELEAGLPALRAWKLEARNPSEDRTEHPELVEGCGPPQSSAVLRQAQEPLETWQDCGRCTRCLDACPTRAFVAPHVLDARRCISYLTIELRGPIPWELRPLMGSWVFGCDVCQDVCPYNRQTKHTSAAADKLGHLHPSASSAVSFSARISVSELLALDDAGFRARFRGTPVLRAKRRGLVRNACIAAGNAGDPALVPALLVLLADPEPLVRGHAAWALGRIGGMSAAQALAQASVVETVASVRAEIARGREMMA